MTYERSCILSNSKESGVKFCKTRQTSRDASCDDCRLTNLLLIGGKISWFSWKISQRM